MELVISKPGWIVPKEIKEFQKKRADFLGEEVQSISDSFSRLYYVQGIQEIQNNDKFIDGKLNNVFINKHDKGISFNIVGKKQHVCMVFLIDEEIKEIYFVDGEEIVKQKNIIGRSAAGALVAGPVGAIIGGMTGLGEIKLQESYLIIKTENEKVIFKCEAGTKEIFEMKFKNIFGSKVITSEEIKRQQEQEFLNNI